MKRTCINFESPEQLAIFKAALKSGFDQSAILRIGTREIEHMYYEYTLDKDSTDEQRKEADVYFGEYFRIVKGKR